MRRGPGDRVAYLDKNSPEQLELFFGAAKLNAVPTPVNFRLAPPEIAYIVARRRAPRCSSSARSSQPVVDKVADELADTSIVVIGGRRRAPDLRRLARRPSGRRPRGPPGPRRRRLPALLVGDDRPSQGRGADPVQPPGGLGLYPGADGPGPRLDQPGRHAAVPHRWWRVGGGRLWRGRHQRARARHRSRRRSGRADRARAHQPRRSSSPPCSSSCWRCPAWPSRDFSALHAILYGASPISETGAVRFDPDLRLPVPPGLRADRDDRHRRAAARRRPRSRRPQPPPPAGRRPGRRRGPRRAIVDAADRRGRGRGRGRRDLDPRPAW